ncbi:hypothetical protein H5410_048394 [Solanum commersonii]|uniref:Uncharacterized protein n=1 Tax=Solanum commersonii TaxID=4109 RepID=A0A9J5XLP3_SOLCO|nr:hypothetical protein H5410_048394 [Solanum commersonii]
MLVVKVLMLALVKRKEKQKVRYDEDCEVSIFELGMVFEGANRFEKAMAIIFVEYGGEIKLRPNEKHRVRVKCKMLIVNGCYMLLLRDSGRIVSQPYIRIWEIQDLVRKTLGLYVGACKGELLVVVGKNGNNQMYPIARAIVDLRNKT